MCTFLLMSLLEPFSIRCSNIEHDGRHVPHWLPDMPTQVA